VKLLDIPKLKKNPVPVLGASWRCDGPRPLDRMHWVYPMKSPFSWPDSGGLVSDIVPKLLQLFKLQELFNFRREEPTCLTYTLLVERHFVVGKRTNRMSVF
jgi:hypothetical protein